MEATGDGGDFGMQPPAFSGPYILEEWKPNQYVKLVRNPRVDAARRRASTRSASSRWTTTKTAETRLRGRRSRLYRRSRCRSLAQVQGNRPPKNTVIEEYPSLYYVWVGMNLDNPALKDINLRKAIQ